jgi:hypothetical protein
LIILVQVEKETGITTAVQHEHHPSIQTTVEEFSALFVAECFTAKRCVLTLVSQVEKTAPFLHRSDKVTVEIEPESRLQKKWTRQWAIHKPYSSTDQQLRPSARM